ncbi:hypothetical protein KJE20_06659 [Pyrenophora tritici-repentis]|nr:hypothetical protein KJE20_06659 [Pyrenophora tritici-repentis]
MEPSTPTSPSPSNIIRLDLTSLTPSPIPTSSPTPILSPTPIQYHESPDEFVQGGITYVKRAIIARKDFRQGTSPQMSMSKLSELSQLACSAN